ncbi:FAD-dependent oxidoreductase [Actinocorallia populi]|uniref:FAD-dependent oxidoreductase n=1 Tax=Actinocorallia populi TaxID=2079200 RepID=UPI000D087228|nr:GMC family oxidoreductase [Actinocorallia populi]
MDYDVLVIGSGFGGAVAALRLSEKGYRVGVLEAGPRRGDHELPRTTWRVRDYLWLPALGLRGIQRFQLLRGRRGRALLLGGAGVGGGSLVSANLLRQPPDDFYADPRWAHITDWRSELAPHCDQAARMLGLTENPSTTDADILLHDVAEDLGLAATYRRAPVAVFFNEPAGAEVPDPYFGGAGPPRRGCIECGECVIGCRHGAKNKLTVNYLHLAERAGAVIHPDSEAVRVRPLRSGGYAVRAVRPGMRPPGTGRTFTARQVVLAAGAYGTQRLLHRMKATGALPGLSDRLGALTRVYAEAYAGAARPRPTGRPLYEGVAVTSSLHPEARTVIEAFRFGRGSDLTGLLRVPLLDGTGLPRPLKLLGYTLRHPFRALDLRDVRRWSERGMTALVRQPWDAPLTLRPRRFSRALHAAGPGAREQRPGWIPLAHRAARLLARRLGGPPSGSLLDLLGLPPTGHFFGGCAIGSSRRTGVIDPYQRVFGHPCLHVADGSALTADPGPSPVLTILAQAERAMSLWPNKGDPDTRPAQGEPYARLAPVPPRHPRVPEEAPAALRVRLPGVTPLADLENLAGWPT